MSHLTIPTNTLAALLPRGATLAAIAACHVAAIAAIAGGGFEPAAALTKEPFVVELLAPPAVRAVEPVAKPVVRRVEKAVSKRKPVETRRKPVKVRSRPRPAPPPALPAKPRAIAPDPQKAASAEQVPAPAPLADLPEVPDLPRLAALTPPAENAFEAETPAAEIARESLTPARFDASYLNNPKPRYPLAARRMGQQGTVVLRVEVSAAGSVLGLQVSESSGFERLDRVALAAVSSWRFVAARRGAVAVASSIQVPIVFRLDK